MPTVLAPSRRLWTPPPRGIARPRARGIVRPRSKRLRDLARWRRSIPTLNATPGTLQRDSSTGKVFRSATTGKLPRNTADNSKCCCAGGCPYCGPMPAAISLNFELAMCQNCLQNDEFNRDELFSYFSWIDTVWGFAGCVPRIGDETSCTYEKILTVDDGIPHMLNFRIPHGSGDAPCSEPLAGYDFTDQMAVWIRVTRFENLWSLDVLWTELGGPTRSPLFPSVYNGQFQPHLNPYYHDPGDGFDDGNYWGGSEGGVSLTGWLISGGHWVAEPGDCMSAMDSSDFIQPAGFECGFFYPRTTPLTIDTDTTASMVPDGPHCDGA